MAMPDLIFTGFVGAIAGAIGALACSALTILDGRYKFKKQLEHDGEQKHRDRMATLRRDVVLGASDKLVAVDNYLGGLADRDPTTAEFGKPIDEAMAALIRLSLVVDDRANSYVNELIVSYPLVLIRCLSAVDRCHALANDSKLLNGLLDQILEEREKIAQRHKDALDAETPDARKLAALESAMAWQMAHFEKKMGEMKKLDLERHEARKAYIAAVGEHLGKVAECKRCLFAQLRIDLRATDQAPVDIARWVRAASSTQDELRAFVADLGPKEDTHPKA